MNAHPRTFLGICYLALGTAALVAGVMWAVPIAFPRSSLDAPEAAYLSCAGLGILASGYGILWGSTYRWPQALVVLALVASAAVALSQVITHWGQPFNSSSVNNLFLSFLLLFFVWLLPRMFAGDRQNRSRQRG